MKAKKIFGIIGNIFVSYIIPIVLLFVAGIGLYTTIAKVVGGNEMPMPFGYGIGVILSGSMEPELSMDDVIIVKDTGDYQLNDVVVFKSGSSLTVHRIVDRQVVPYEEYVANYEGAAYETPILNKKEESDQKNDNKKDVVVITTQGDANNTPDKPIKEDDIVGEVIHVFPNAGRVVDFLKTPVIALAAAAVAVMLMQMSFKKKKKNDEEELDDLLAEIAKLSANESDNLKNGALDLEEDDNPKEAQAENQFNQENDCVDKSTEAVEAKKE